MKNTWLSLLCPSCRPNDLKRWLDSLYENCVDPKGIELSLVVEVAIDRKEYLRWGHVVETYVEHGEYTINELVEICYKQSSSPYIFLSGDDSICRTKNWDEIFRNKLAEYKDNVVLIYPNDLIFGQELACYPVTTRLVMDLVPWPVPYKRYAIDDTIFDLVPYERRIYLPNVIMEHLHLVDNPPGKAVIRDGKVKYYPLNPELLAEERKLFNALKPQRDEIRHDLYERMSDKKELKVFIAVPTMEFARQAVFYDYFNQLDKPLGTAISFCHGQSPAKGRNLLIEQALDHNCSHILFIDDDVIIRPDLLRRLLSHNKDIVSGLYLMRSYPHYPIVFDNAHEDGSVDSMIMTNQQGLIPIKAAGLGCCLIKTEIFREMERPWVRLGELTKDGWCDDIGFFYRVRQMGYEIYCDLNAQCGHMATVTIWPAFMNNQWMVNYDTGGTGSITAQVTNVIRNNEEREVIS